jgi:hypothetical protein
VTPKELAEREGKPIAIAWIDAATSALRDYEAWLAGGVEPATRALVASALATNFALRASAEPREIREHVASILDMFARSREILVRSDRWFVGVTEQAARHVFGAGSDIPPAYAIFEEAIYFTSRFAPHDPATGRGFGPLCRAAMVLHESVHVVDPRSGEPDVHVSEWDEPRFSAQTPDESLHNPSAYASFAAQVHTGAVEWPRAARFGAGRPAE